MGSLIASAFGLALGSATIYLLGKAVVWAVCYVVKLLFKMTKKWLDVFRDRHPNATHAKIIKDYLDNGTVRVIHIGLTNGEAMEEDGCILDTDEGLDEKLDSKFAGKSEMRVTC